MNLTTYSQRDGQWANDKINNTASTLGKYGCTITCIGMLTDRNPRDANNWMKSLGAFQNDLVLWSKVPGFQPNGRFYCADKPAPMDEIKRKINAGFPVLFNVSFAKNPAKPDHWVLGVEVQGDNIIINDPWYGDRTTVAPRYGKSAAGAILGGSYFEINKGTPPPPPPPPPSDPCAEVKKERDAKIDELTTELNKQIGNSGTMTKRISELETQLELEVQANGILRGQLEKSQTAYDKLDGKLAACEAKPPTIITKPVEEMTAVEHFAAGFRQLFKKKGT